MEAFGRQLMEYKRAIDADIATYADHVRQSTRAQFGEYPAVVTDAYLDMLSRGGKRIRGALVMAGYAMCGGADQVMITRAATALEMIHAYILIIDDIQDRSSVRRGKPTVHEILARYHREKGLRGDPGHAGVALALNAALSGAHAAQILLAGLSVSEELRLKALGIINLTMVTTAHGQTADIMNELLPEVDSEGIEQALEWKTAHYTILNPLCVGMVLAGAGCGDTDAIREYALHTGKAFQITDDIIGIFGDDRQTGKSVKDDIREGKRTVLTSYALAHASEPDKRALAGCLGDAGLTDEAFENCRRILRECGALAYARTQAEEHVRQAIDSLGHIQRSWDQQSVSFLRGLAMSLLHRAN